MRKAIDADKRYGGFELARNIAEGISTVHMIL